MSMNPVDPMSAGFRHAGTTSSDLSAVRVEPAARQAGKRNGPRTGEMAFPTCQAGGTNGSGVGEVTLPSRQAGSASGAGVCELVSPTCQAGSGFGLNAGQAALVRVLTGLLTRSVRWSAAPAEAERAATRAVARLRTALELMSGLREAKTLVWDDLVHRRLRILPVGVGADEVRPRLEAAWALPGTVPSGVDPGPAPTAAELAAKPAKVEPGPDKTEAAPRLVRTCRGGWEMTEVTALAKGARVTLWLARPEGRPRSGPAGHPRTRQVLPDAAAGAPLLVLGPKDVLAWAQGSGDDNRIHLAAGAARRMGLTEGDGVVAHGMLLAALSLALAPATGGVDLRLPAPLVVEGATPVRARGGDLYGPDGLVLRRRDSGT